MYIRMMNLAIFLRLLIHLSWQLRLSWEQNGLLDGASRRDLRDTRPPLDTNSFQEHRDNCIQHCKWHAKFCSCSESCLLFNDCCDDVSFPRFPFDDRIVQMISYQTSCLELGKIQAHIVNECPDNVTIASSLNDTKLKEVLPVTDENNITFKNEYYAKCHGVSSYSPWRIKFSGIAKTCGNSGGTYAYADPTIKLFSNTSRSLSELADFLLENGCGYEVFPPQGRSAHFCRNIVEIQNCSDLVRPVLEMKSVSYYRNAECCITSGICKTTHDYTCLAIGYSFTDPFDVARYGNLHSSVILLDFTNKNEEKDKRTSSIQYLNIKFEKTLTSATYQDINDEVIYSTYCLLKHYFDHVTDVFVIDRLEMHVENISMNGQSPLFLLSYTFDLLSNRIIEDIEEVETMNNWLESMEMIYTLNITDEEGVKETYFELALLNEKDMNISHGNVNVSRFTYLSKRVNQRGLFMFGGIVVPLHSAVCRMLKHAQKPPTSRCERLYAFVALNSANLNIQWNCTTPSDNNQKHGSDNIVSSPSTGKTLSATCVVLLFFTTALVV